MPIDISSTALDAPEITTENGVEEVNDKSSVKESVSSVVSSTVPDIPEVTIKNDIEEMNNEPPVKKKVFQHLGFTSDILVTPSKSVRMPQKTVCPHATKPHKRNRKLALAEKQLEKQKRTILHLRQRNTRLKKKNVLLSELLNHLIKKSLISDDAENTLQKSTEEPIIVDPAPSTSRTSALTPTFFD